MMPTGGFHSQDRAWWWNGTNWYPALSPDRRWWFDGTNWVSAAQPGPSFKLQRRDLLLGGTWVAWLIAVLVFLASILPLPDRAGPVVGWGAVFIGILSLAMMTLGGYDIARRKRDTVYLLIGLVWALGMVAYVTAMLLAPQPGGVEDDAAGAGLVLLSVPWLMIVSAFVGTGFGIGLVVRRRDERPHEMGTVTVGPVRVG